MKKSLSIALSLASATMISASVIDWEIPNLTDGDGHALSYDVDDIVFIADVPGVYDSATGKLNPDPAPSGANKLIDQDDKYMAGTWTDSLSGPVTYYMALKSGNSYYALSDGNNSAMIVSVSDTTGADPLIPDSAVGAKVRYASFTTTPSGTVGTVAPSVPEPATAALAFAGIAMLIRRRRGA